MRYLFLLLFCAGLWGGPSLCAQRALRCGSEALLDRCAASGPCSAAREAAERDYRDLVSSAAKSLNVLEVPVVFHLVYAPGIGPGSPGYLNDADVLEGLAAVNAVLAGALPCHAPPGTPPGAPAGIELCLARRDIRGHPSPAVLRYASDLALFDLCTQDAQLKALRRTADFDPYPDTDYLNIYLVAEICASCLPYDCAVAGVSAYPFAHGGPADGIVLESRHWNPADCADRATPVHELGHYFNLLHTFEGGCLNDDCMTQGDRVCDTPPDNNADAWPHNPCLAGQTNNSCTTDVNPADLNNPFSQDQPDPDDNFMDYAPNGCALRFTPGQALRMRATLLGPRASLLDSRGCEPPCPQPLSLDFLIPDSLFAGEEAFFENLSPDSATFTWTLGDTVLTGRHLHFAFPASGAWQISLQASNGLPVCAAEIRRTVQVRCRAGALIEPDAGYYEPGQGAVLVNAAPGQPGVSFSWLYNGLPAGSGDTLLLDSLPEGNHSAVLLACNTWCCSRSAPALLRAGVCESPRVYENWIFGQDSAWLSFAGGYPQTMPQLSQLLSPECSAVVSDTAGNLLFYTNGSRVLNAQHQYMEGGPFIMGNASSTQCLALRQPGSDDRYYLFYPQAASSFSMEWDTTARLHYAHIDMSANGGLGRIVAKDLLMLQPTTEKVSAARHCNGVDWWVLGHEAGSNRFFAWLFDSQGLHPPVISSVGRPNSGFYLSKAGYLKVSHDLSRVAMTTAHDHTTSTTFNGFVELFDFDNATGVLSNPLLLMDSLRNPYGLEFSPDNSKLYQLDNAPGVLYQYDLSLADPDSIRASRTAVFTFPPQFGNGGALQIGPDNLIYASISSRTRLGVIRNPNLKGAECDFVFEGPDLGGRRAFLGLVNTPADAFRPDKPHLAGPRRIDACADPAPRLFRVQSNCRSQEYAWELRGKSRILFSEGDSVWVEPGTEGSDTLILHKFTACRTASDTLVFQVSDCPPVCHWEFQWIEADTVVCGGQPAYARFSSNADSVLLRHAAGPLIGPVAAGAFSFPLSSQDACYDLHLFRGARCDTLIRVCVQVNPAQTFQWLHRDTAVCVGNTAMIDFVSDAETVELFNVQHPGLRQMPVLPLLLGPVYADSCYALRLRSESAGCDTLIYFCIALRDGALPDTIHIPVCSPALEETLVEAFTDMHGCDSTVVREYRFDPALSDTVQVNAQTCDPASAGVQAFSYVNMHGCDSTVIVTTVLLPSDTVQFSAQTCDPASAGVQVFSYANMHGCDSTVIVSTALLPSDTVQVSAQTCDPALAGVQTFSYANIHGCDSTVIVTTALLPSDTVQVNAQTCDPALAGVQAFSYANMHGCDSTVIVSTALLPSDTVQVSAQTCDPALAGVQAFSYANMHGCDSTVIVSTALLPSDTVQVNAQTCDPALAGVQTFNYTNIHGCDSTVIVSTVLLPSDTVQVSAQTCDPALAGVQAFSYANMHGCDSTVIVTTALLPDFSLIVAVTQDTVIASGNPVLLNVLAARPAQVLWMPENTLDCAYCPGTIAWPATTTHYTVSVQDSLGCTEIAGVWVTVRPQRTLYAPNAFSPNGDGINDMFTVYGAAGAFELRRLLIFNRWGSLVFESAGAAWTGDSAPAGVYVYQALVLWPDGKEEWIAGELMLMR
ncbi:MAG: gliding motility-associated C-terminal domain-containing protein [Saprospiraceae bacterium]|nr:gliding motility-associated C-terminal domain-containing protein [Saprospiraceae bacterium]